MSEQIPERADIRQLRTQAKELLRELQSEAGSGPLPKLAEAQLMVARKYGFDSWPKLVDKVETPALIERFKSALEAGDASALAKLLKSKQALRKHINEPMFSFDSPPIMRASQLPAAPTLLPILVQNGADPNARSKWWAGGFSALDMAKGTVVDLLIDLGAKFDVWSASAHGRIDVLREILDQDPAAVNAPGGDGERPLHFAANAEVAELLIERGADLEVRDIDHEATPIQYQINNVDVVRVLLRHGAKPDIFTAAVLDDVELARRILAEEPHSVAAHVGQPPFKTEQSDGGHIYTYALGGGSTPFQVAADRGSRLVLAELMTRLSPSQSLVAAAWIGDGDLVRSIVKDHPTLSQEMGPEATALAHAAQAGKVETVRLLLEAGLDPKTTGMDSGTALHLACWYGYVEVVRLLIGRVPLDLCDANHGSPPLGWATHGANHCRNRAGDYVAVVEALIEAGADPHASANSVGTSMLDQAGNREDVKQVLKRFGAR